MHVGPKQYINFRAALSSAFSPRWDPLLFQALGSNNKSAVGTHTLTFPLGKSSLAWLLHLSPSPFPLVSPSIHLIHSAVAPFALISIWLRGDLINCSFITDMWATFHHPHRFYIAATVLLRIWYFLFVCLLWFMSPLLCNCVIMSASVLIRGRTSLVCRSCVLSLYGKLRLKHKTIRLYLYVGAFLLWLQHSGTDGKWSGLILANK